MASRFLRYLVNLIVLTTMTVAGLPLVVCVSQTHGTAIEIERAYVAGQAAQNSQDHFVLFSSSNPEAGTSDCQDFRLQRGALLGQSRDKEVAKICSHSSNGNAPVILTAAAFDFKHRTSSEPDGKLFQRNALILRSALSDRRSIVLQI